VTRIRDRAVSKGKALRRSKIRADRRVAFSRTRKAAAARAIAVRRTLPIKTIRHEAIRDSKADKTAELIVEGETMSRPATFNHLHALKPNRAKSLSTCLPPLERTELRIQDGVPSIVAVTY